MINRFVVRVKNVESGKPKGEILAPKGRNVRKAEKNYR